MSHTCDCALPSTLLGLGEHEVFQAADKVCGEIEGALVCVWRDGESRQCYGAEKSKGPGGILAAVEKRDEMRWTTDLVVEGGSLEAVLGGPVFGRGELGMVCGEVEQGGGAFKGETAEGDGDGRGGVKDMGIGKLEADLCGGQGGTRESGSTDVRGKLFEYGNEVGMVAARRQQRSKKERGYRRDEVGWCWVAKGVPLGNVVLVSVWMVLGVLVEIVAHASADLSGICFFQGKAEMVWHLVLVATPLSHWLVIVLHSSSPSRTRYLSYHHHVLRRPVLLLRRSDGQASHEQK